MCYTFGCPHQSPYTGEPRYGYCWLRPGAACVEKEEEPEEVLLCKDASGTRRLDGVDLEWVMEDLREYDLVGVVRSGGVVHLGEPPDDQAIYLEGPWFMSGGEIKRSARSVCTDNSD